MDKIERFVIGLFVTIGLLVMLFVGYLTGYTAGTDDVILDIVTREPPFVIGLFVTIGLLVMFNVGYMTGYTEGHDDFIRDIATM